MKSPEQRLDDVTKELARRLRFGMPPVEELARAVLEAADREPASWPTDESLHAAYTGPFGGRDDGLRAQLRDAFLADPIIKAAIAYRDGNAPTGLTSAEPNLVGRFGVALIKTLEDSGL